jgi:hypothetical protein
VRLICNLRRIRIGRTTCAFAILLALAPALCRGEGQQESFADDWSVYTRGESFSYSETISAYQWLFGSLDGPTRKGEKAFSSSFAEAGVRRLGFSIGAFYRYDYYADFDYDTFNLLRADELNRELEPNRPYRIDAEVDHFEGWGIRLAYRGTLPGRVRFEVGLGYLFGMQTIEGRLKGALVDDGESYSAQASINYAYSTDNLLSRRAPEPEGHGIQTDLFVSWEVTEWIRVHCRLRDPFTAIYWLDRPYTNASLVFNAANSDEGGFAIRRPILFGVEGFENEWQQIPMKAEAGLHLALSERYSASTDVLVVQDIALPRLAFSAKLGDWHAGLGFRFIANSVGLTFSRDDFYLSFETDHPNLAKARTLAMRLNWAL